MTPYLGTSISIGSLKSAALYFDYVIPINLGAEFSEAGGLASFSTELAALLRSLRELVPPTLIRNEVFVQRLALLNKSTTELIMSNSRHPAMADGLHMERARATREAIYAFIDQFGLNTALMDCRSNLFEESGRGQSALTLLVSLNLIDAEHVPWDAIIELRKDLEAQERLRRLRLFAYENYEGKSKTYVEDDIFSRIWDYEREAQRWGFEMTHSTLNTVLSSKVLGGSVVGSFLSILAGAPTIAAVGGLGVGVLELGRVTMEVVKRNTALVDLERQNPVSYISYARKKLGKVRKGARKRHRPERKPW